MLYIKFTQQYKRIERFKKLFFRIFSIPELLYRFVKMHILQPKHTILSEKETKELLQELNINISQLPKIKKDDPALPQNAKIGDVIKIERKSEGGVTNYYRVVSA